MKRVYFLLIILMSFSCKEEVVHDSLILDNISLFHLYDTSCESWLEKKFPCDSDNCFSSAAVEIVAIDTSDSTRFYVYAWSWSEHFIQNNNKDYRGNNHLLITKFTVDPTSRAKKIMEVFIADSETPIEEQLIQNGFPEKIIEQYFTGQSENIITIRLQALTKKARDKYNLYKEHVYTPETNFAIDTMPTLDTL